MSWKTSSAETAQKPILWECHKCKNGPLHYRRDTRCGYCGHVPCGDCKKNTDIAQFSKRSTAQIGLNHYVKENFWYCCQICSLRGPWRCQLTTRCISCEHARCEHCLVRRLSLHDNFAPISADLFAADTLFELEDSTYQACQDILQSAGVDLDKLADRFEKKSLDTSDSPPVSEGEISFMYGSGDSEDDTRAECRQDRLLLIRFTNLTLKGFAQHRFHGRPAGSSSGPKNNAGHFQNKQQTSECVKPSSAAIPTSNKRRSRSRKPSDDSDEDDEDKSAKKPCKQSGKTVTKRLLACPYYRFDIDRYSERNVEELCYRGCSSVCLRDISRLKQHLYRVHRRPEYYCGSCYNIFETQDQLDAHARVRPACEISPSRFQEKMNKDQVNVIKRRNVGSSPREEWRNIFKILFPDAPVPSPSLAYADCDSSEVIQDFLTFFETEGPGMLQSFTLEHMNGRILLDNETKTFLDEALEIAAARLISLLRPRLALLGAAKPEEQNEDGVEEGSQHLNTAAFAEPELADEMPSLEEFLNMESFAFELTMEQWIDGGYLS